MTQFTLYEKATGKIVQSGNAVDPLRLETETLAVLLDAALDDTLFKVDPETGEAFPYVAPLTASELTVAINRERQRRIEQGKDFGGVYVTGSEKDIINLTNLALGAQLRISMGDGSITVFRDGNNVDHPLTPDGVLSLWMTTSAHVSAIYQASWALKAMDPTPGDMTDDQYWP